MRIIKCESAEIITEIEFICNRCGSIIDSAMPYEFGFEGWFNEKDIHIDLCEHCADYLYSQLSVLGIKI